MKNIMDKASELKNNAASQIKQIQSDKDLTQTAKAKRIAEIRGKTNDELSALQNENAKANTQGNRKQFRAIYRNSTTSSRAEAAHILK